MSNIIRTDPFFETASLRDRVNQIFNHAFAGFHDNAFELPFPSLSFLPPVDISEGGHNIILKAEIPGVKVEDLGITLENNVLTLTGERKFNNEEEKENYHRIETRYGKFTRSFTLPAAVDSDNVSATFENGILKVTLPKREEFKAKQITIGVTKTPPVAVKTAKQQAA